MDQGTTERLPRVALPQLIGRTLASRYELYDDVGRGPLAHVYRAWDHQINHGVALKILDPQFLGDDDVVDAYEQEARRAASLPSHQNIVSVHAVGREGAVPYIVMEYVPRQSLRTIIDAEAPLGVHRALEICRQVAQGLDFAQQYGVVHGNIKPENILLPNSGQAKVTDFGIGRAAERAETRGALSPRARLRYLSPEEALGRKPGPASDVYSLGVVLFEMLTRTQPFQGGTPSSLVSHPALTSPRDPHRLNPALPPALGRIVLRALATNPQGRYRTAGAFASALHQYLRLEAGSTVLDLSAGQISHSSRSFRTEPARPCPPPAPRSSRTRPVRRAPSATKSRRLTFTSLAFVVALLIALAGGWLAYRAIAPPVRQWGESPSLTAAPSVKHQGSTHAAPPKQGRVAAAKSNRAGPGCGTEHVGPVRFLRMWADKTTVAPGGSVTFQYTIANDSHECRSVRLGAAAVSGTQLGLVFRDPSNEKPVGALPGIHTYKRSFVVPTTAAGQRLDVVLQVVSPSRANTYGVIRLNHLITVTP